MEGPGSSVLSVKVAGCPSAPLCSSPKPDIPPPGRRPAARNDIAPGSLGLPAGSQALVPTVPSLQVGHPGKVTDIPCASVSSSIKGHRKRSQSKRCPCALPLPCPSSYWFRPPRRPFLLEAGAGSTDCLTAILLSLSRGRLAILPTAGSVLPFLLPNTDPDTGTNPLWAGS